MDWKKYVGKKILAKKYIGLGMYSDRLSEIKVLAVSSSGKFVKVQYESGNTDWIDIRDIVFVEELGVGEEDRTEGND